MGLTAKVLLSLNLWWWAKNSLLKLGIACPWGFFAFRLTGLSSGVMSYRVKNKGKQPRFQTEKGREGKMLKTPLCWTSRNEIGNWMDWEHSKRNFKGKKQWKETLPNRWEWLTRSLIWVRSSRRVVKSRQATVRKCGRKQKPATVFFCCHSLKRLTAEH